MKNVTDLRTELVSVFSAVKSKKMELSKAKSLVQTSHAIMKTAIAELNYNKHMGTKKKIKFLEQ